MMQSSWYGWIWFLFQILALWSHTHFQVEALWFPFYFFNVGENVVKICKLIAMLKEAAMELYQGCLVHHVRMHMMDHVHLQGIMCLHASYCKTWVYYKHEFSESLIKT